jgi:hypothetical protein
MKNKETLLFNIKNLRKFFDILDRMGRVVENRYQGYDKKNPHMSPCEKEVFVNRTLNRWFKNKYLVWYRKSEQTGLFYRSYISITNIRFALGWGDDLEVYYYDYSNPVDVWNSVKLNFNDISGLEGEWSKTPKKHHQLLKLTLLDIPEKEYVFKAYDWELYPKRKKKGWSNDDVLKSMETTVSFKAKTVAEAYDQKRKFQENGGNKLMISPDIMEIKTVI